MGATWPSLAPQRRRLDNDSTPFLTAPPWLGVVAYLVAPLGPPTILVPYANANNRQHSPNEHARLDHLFQGIRTTAGLLEDLGGLST
jgi:acetylornithine deacetylase/succinyl-diaminopimelate desuccinylase-like protein